MIYVRSLLQCLTASFLSVLCASAHTASGGNVSPQQFVPADVNIADGQSHPLFTRFQSLDQAKARYGFVTSLNNEFAWVGWQMALNRARSTGRVIINAPPGTYRVHPLLFYSNTTITGAGYTLILVFEHPPQTEENQRLLSPATYKDHLTFNFNMEGGILDGNWGHTDWRGVRADGGAHGLSLWGVRGGIIRNMLIRNMFTDGIYVVSLFHRAEQDSENLKFDHIRIEHCRRQGVSIGAGSNLEFNNFTIRDIEGTGPGAAFDLEPNTKFEAIRNVTIANVVGDQLSAGILITSVATPPLTDNITVTNVHLTNITNTYGFLAHNMSHLNVKGYHVEMAPNVRTYPAMELNNLQSATLQDVYTRNGIFGIRVWLGAKDVTIDTADVADAWMYGVSLESNTSGTLRNATISDNNQSGRLYSGVFVASPGFRISRLNSKGNSQAFAVTVGAPDVTIEDSTLGRGKAGTVFNTNHHPVHFSRVEQQ